MSTLLWIIGAAVALIASHGFAYWRGAVAGEARARQQAQEIINWAEHEARELSADAGDAIRKWVDRLKGRLGL